MDLIKIKKSAILIPTPRQTEQEYLAEYLSEVGYFVSYRQKSINISSAVENFLNFKPKFANFTFRQEIFLYEIERLLAINN
jgi:NAD-specific glutamate dehydrogenase